jgi:hypothetical protein
MASSVATHRVRSVAARTRAVVRATAFWTAVALPVAIVGLLALGSPLRVIGILLVCDAAALVVGHGHAADHSNREH